MWFVTLDLDETPFQTKQGKGKGDDWFRVQSKMLIDIGARVSSSAYFQVLTT